MESMNNGKVLFFAYSDGSVEYRDRVDMSETFNDGNLERVWHLSQVGFTYPEDEPCMNFDSNTTIKLISSRLANCVLSHLLLTRPAEG